MNIDDVALLNEGQYGAKWQELQSHLAIMQEQVMRRLDNWNWKQPMGGLFLWLRLPEGDVRELAQEALHHGVLVTPGSPLSVEEEYSRYVRLSYVRSPEEIIAGVERLQEAWGCYEARLRASGPGLVNGAPTSGGAPTVERGILSSL